jgi:glycosyltransferase involved in cell wall biosynthesis
MPQVLASLPDARLQVAGGGGLPAELAESVAAAVDVAGPGPLDELPARYRAATVTVLPSVDEAFGLVLVESLACGTPVVASRSGGMPEIVSAGVGELVPPDDADALANAIISVVRLAAEPATPARCAKHADQWSWEQAGPAHLAAYELGMMQP